MLPNYGDLLIKRFEQPDEVRTFEKGKFETVKIGSMTIGRASYEPGWKWSEHVGAATGAKLCEVEHVGMVVSGYAACRMQDGRYYEMHAGDLFYIGPGHDSWVEGEEPGRTGVPSGGPRGGRLSHDCSRTASRISARENFASHHRTGAGHHVSRSVAGRSGQSPR